MAGIPKLHVVRPRAKQPPEAELPGGKVEVTIGGKPWKKPKTPKLVAEAADALYKLRELRLAAQKVVDELAEAEGEHREFLIENLPKSKASGAVGQYACAKIEKKDKPRVVDWDKFYTYIKKQNRFDLLQKRVSEAAMYEMWEDKKEVPGTEHYTVLSVSCTKK